MSAVFFKDTVDFQPGPGENICVSLGMDDAYLVRFPQGCLGGAVANALPVRWYRVSRIGREIRRILLTQLKRGVLTASLAW